MSYKDTILPIIRETRSISLPQWGNINTIDQKSSHPADVVTELDGKIEKFLSSKLKELYPDIEFVGEEYGGNKEAKKFWLVDPIDGTAHYVRGLPFCTTMLALIEEGEVIFSAIYDFVNDDMYWAEKGKGAYKNSEKLQVSDKDIKGAYVFWETHMEKKENQDMLVKLGETVPLMKTISAGWEFAMVASGKVDGRIGFDPWGKDYDFAPGALLVKEAGGIVTNVCSESYNYRNRGHIVGGFKVHTALQNLFSDYSLTETFNS